MRIAGIQTDVVFRDVNANLTSLESHVRSEVAQGTQPDRLPRVLQHRLLFRFA